MPNITVDDATRTYSRLRRIRLDPYMIHPSGSGPAIDYYVDELSSPQGEHIVVFSPRGPVFWPVHGTMPVDDPVASGLFGLGTTDLAESGIISFQVDLTNLHRRLSDDFFTTGVVEDAPGSGDAPIEQRTQDARDANRLFDRLHALDTGLSDRLNNLRTLEPDWDGYGGNPPTEKSLGMTAFFLLLAHKLTRGTLKAPFVAPLPDGGLELEWELESGAELMLVIPAAGTSVRYLLDELTDSGEISESEGAVPKDASVSELIDRLTR